MDALCQKKADKSSLCEADCTNGQYSKYWADVFSRWEFTPPGSNQHCFFEEQVVESYSVV